MHNNTEIYMYNVYITETSKSTFNFEALPCVSKWKICWVTKSTESIDISTDILKTCILYILGGSGGC